VTVNRVGSYASQPGGTPDVINFNIAGGGVKIISVTGTAEPTIIMPLAAAHEPGPTAECHMRPGDV
jgi:hypothetical protein